MIAYRENDDVFGLTDMVAYELTDNRTEKNTQHSMIALLRQSVNSRLVGYDDTNDDNAHFIETDGQTVQLNYLKNEAVIIKKILTL